jgi:hypothetical protein
MTHGSTVTRPAPGTHAAGWIAARRQMFVLRGQFTARLLALGRSALAPKAAVALDCTKSAKAEITMRTGPCA